MQLDNPAWGRWWDGWSMNSCDCLCPMRNLISIQEATPYSTQSHSGDLSYQCHQHHRDTCKYGVSIIYVYCSLDCTIHLVPMQAHSLTFCDLSDLHSHICTHTLTHTQNCYCPRPLVYGLEQYILHWRLQYVFDCWRLMHSAGLQACVRVGVLVCLSESACV